jgi:hypothetical protein
MKHHVTNACCIFRSGAHRETSFHLQSTERPHPHIAHIHNFYRRRCECRPQVPVIVRRGACDSQHKAGAEHCETMPNNPRNRKASLPSPPLSGPPPKVGPQCSRRCNLHSINGYTGYQARYLPLRRQPQHLDNKPPYPFTQLSSSRAFYEEA